MSSQLGFDWTRQDPQPLTLTPASRLTDPETSNQAEQLMNVSGLRATHQHLIRDYVREHPGETVGEIARGLQLERAAVSKRMKELEPIWITRGEARRCSVQQTNQLTWWPTEAAACPPQSK